LDTASNIDYTTPAGHKGITFIASAGDSGAISEISSPAASPNVLSVGGTDLSVDQFGAYAGESAWGNAAIDAANGSEPGISAYQPEPQYQEQVQQTTYREVSDVSYDADPGTGFAIYDSVSAADGNTLPNVGWNEIGGTSAGAPQWAALMAVVDQGRALEGLDTLDGETQTLPMLYSIYSAPGTAGYANYASYFNDVTTGGAYGEVFENGGVGYALTAAAGGWDPVTGLGTPKVPAIVNLLDTPPAIVPTGTVGNGATTGGSPWSANAAVTPSPLLGKFTTPLPAGVITGAAGKLKLQLTDISASEFSGPLSITLEGSTNGIGDVPIATFSYSQVTLLRHHSTSELLKFTYPSTLDGTYYLVAFVSTQEAGTGIATVVTSNSAFIGPPTVDLGVAFGGTTPVRIVPGANHTATITVTNEGNILASGVLNLALYASADAVLDSSDTQLTSIPAKAIRLAPRKSITFHVTFKTPDSLVGGNFDLIASISSTTSPSDAIGSNNNASTGTTA
jgi:hypothetical protein